MRYEILTGFSYPVTVLTEIQNLMDVFIAGMDVGQGRLLPAGSRTQPTRPTANTARGVYFHQGCIVVIYILLLRFSYQ